MIQWSDKQIQGVDLAHRVPDLWPEVPNTVQEVVVRSIHKKNTGITANWLSEEALQIAEKRQAETRKDTAT